MNGGDVDDTGGWGMVTFCANGTTIRSKFGVFCSEVVSDSEDSEPRENEGAINGDTDGALSGIICLYDDGGGGLSDGVGPSEIS